MHKESDNAHWEAIAGDFDARVGDDGNSFHRNLIRPATLRLLDPVPGERILDVACGNGVFSRYLAGLVTYNYIEEQRYSYQVLADNEKSAYHWHRSLQDLLGICFSAGFVVDGLEEPVYAPGKCTHLVWTKVPLPIVVRLRKMKVENCHA